MGGKSILVIIFVKKVETFAKTYHVFVIFSIKFWCEHSNTSQTQLQCLGVQFYIKQKETDTDTEHLCSLFEMNIFGT